MNIFGHINNCTIISNETIYNSSEDKKKDKSEESDDDSDTSDNSEVVPFEEIDSKPKQEEPHSDQPNKQPRDYTQSPLYELMTYPEHAQYLLEWLHKTMDNQKSGRSIILPLKAVYEKGLFKTRIPYTSFVEEFGDSVSQTYYSKLMSSDDKYTDDEITLVLEGLDLRVFMKLKNQ